MKYLVDANVLSEATKPIPERAVVEWLSRHEGDLVVDSIILGELCFGILVLPAGRKKAQLQAWFEQVVERIDCLPWDGAVSRRWAALLVALQKQGATLPILDAMIAATALEHGLTVVTRNVHDFGKAGVKVLNPFP